MEKATANAIKQLTTGYSYVDKGVVGLIKRFIEDGDPAALKGLIKAKIDHGWGYRPLRSALGRPSSDPSENDLRVLICLLVTDNDSKEWIKEATADGTTGLGDALLEAGLPVGLVGVALESVLPDEGEPEIEGAAAWFLARNDSELDKIAKKLKSSAPYGFDTQHQRLSRLLAYHAPDRLEKKLLHSFLPKKGKAGWGVRGALAESPSPSLAKIGYAASKKCDNPREKFIIVVALHAKDPKRYGADALEVARESLAGQCGDHDHEEVGKWMLKHHGEKILPDLIAHAVVKQDKKHYWIHDTDRREILDAAVNTLGEKSAPLLKAAAEGAAPDVRFSAMKHLISLGGSQYDETIRKVFEDRAGNKEMRGEDLVPAVAAVARWKPDLIEDTLWVLFKHKSKPVRECTARALAAGGDPMVEKALPHLAAKSATPRLAAIILLSHVGSDAATAALEERLDVEENEDVRDQILLALESVWEKQGRELDLKELRKRAKKAIARGLPDLPKWLKAPPLGGIKLTKGGKLSEDEVRYLIYRQSRAKEMRPDVEAKPLLALVDRSSSSALADAVLDGFLKSKQDAKDRWAMALAALLGGNSLVPKLVRQIHEWPKKSRHKLSEYAVQALALVNTDAALMAVDSMTIRYRSKFKNVGAAAAEAFREAAEAQGISPDELGDRVVPRLGFPQGETTQILEGGGRKVEVSVGLDLKFRYRDLEKNKVIKSLPPALGADHKAAMKERAATMREVVKAQNLRLENLLVRQYRWDSERWRELFVQHPLLKPYGVRLLWARYTKEGEPQKVFRALEDGSLTNAQDEEVKLPKNARIGLIHPLLMSKAQIAEWSEHLSDYEISPPFPQLERPVVRPTDKELDEHYYKEAEGKQLGGLTFKGRAERLGWNRGSVVDAGGISSYYKSFPNAGADVFIDIEDMWIGMSYDDGDITLGRAYFVKHGSVVVGSYTYDEPGSRDDERLLKFGSVPPIVYSEAVSDLKRIVGDTDQSEN